MQIIEGNKSKFCHRIKLKNNLYKKNNFDNKHAFTFDILCKKYTLKSFVMIGSIKQEQNQSKKNGRFEELQHSFRKDNSLWPIKSMNRLSFR